MIDYLQQKVFGILTTKEAIVGVTRGNDDINGWFPPAIGHNTTTYLWRITSTVLNTLDESGYVTDKTLEKLGFSTVLTKWKFEF